MSTYIFIPDRGETVYFEAETEADAQEYAATEFHGRPGAVFVLSPVFGMRVRVPA